jgi:hypothetical protein
MVKTFVDLLIERQKRKERHFKNWRFYLKKIKRKAKRILGKKTKVFLFQFHFAKPEEFEGWYKKFIKRDLLEIK